MQVLFLVLDKTELLNRILKTFLDCGIRGATVISSTGMGRVLSDEVPLFSDLRAMFQDGRQYNYTIFAVIKDEEKIERLIVALKKVLGDLEKPGTGIMFTVPVTRVIGLAGEAGS
ncbi:MAG TPA: hypothetical protein GX506_10230 [Firmicutes bacterium]|nr:hypothetical protein [Bacillota bacterium]